MDNKNKTVIHDDGSVSSYYNVAVKTFPSGLRQVFVYDKPIDVNKRPALGVCDGSKVEQKELENASRARRAVYDIALSNHWDWFVTLTLDPSTCNRYDYNDCVNALQSFMRQLRRLHLGYLIVPEKHKDGGYHFHGLVAGALPVVLAYNPHTGKPLQIKNRQIYNVTCYHGGFTTATKVSDSNKAAGYLSKYLSKDLSCPKGRRRYWHSSFVCKPNIEKFWIDQLPDFGEITYSKDITSPDGSLIHFLEYGGMV